MKLFLIFWALQFSISLRSQNVGIGTANPAPSAQLEVKSTNKGFLPPRMNSAQRNAIQLPAEGLVIWNTECKELQVFNGTVWTNAIGGTACNNYMPVITSCNKVWMAINLNVTTYRNGDTIPNITDSLAWHNLTTGAWCWYKNDSATYGAVYGKLYNWYAVNDPRGLAPVGWHIPTDAEWDSLAVCLGGENFAGGALKESDTLHWTSPNFGATNSSGFTALPGGMRFNNFTSNFEYIHNYAYFWTATSVDSLKASYRLMHYTIADIISAPNPKGCAFSIRCIKD